MARSRARRVTGADGRTRQIDADWFVSAMPAERIQKLLSRKLLRADEKLAGINELYTDWMSGVQFFLRKRIDITAGHVTYVDSEWALTSLTQAQFWAERDFAADYGDGDAVDCLSVDISDWDTPGPLTGKIAKKCTRAEIKREVWHQITEHLKDTDPEILDPELRAFGVPRSGDPVASGPRAQLERDAAAGQHRRLVGQAARAEDGASQPVPLRRLRAQRHRSGDDGGRQRDRPGSYRGAARGLWIERRRPRRCTGSTTRPRWRPRRPPTSSSTARACRTHSTSRRDRRSHRARRRGRRRRSLCGVCGGDGARPGRSLGRVPRAGDLPRGHALDPPAVSRRRPRAQAPRGTRPRAGARTAAPRGGVDGLGPVRDPHRLHTGRRSRLRAVRAKARARRGARRNRRRRRGGDSRGLPRSRLHLGGRANGRRPLPRSRRQRARDPRAVWWSEPTGVARWSRARRA